MSAWRSMLIMPVLLDVVQPSNVHSDHQFRVCPHAQEITKDYVTVTDYLQIKVFSFTAVRGTGTNRLLGVGCWVWLHSTTWPSSCYVSGVGTPTRFQV